MVAVASSCDPQLSTHIYHVVYGIYFDVEIPKIVHSRHKKVPWTVGPDHGDAVPGSSYKMAPVRVQSVSYVSNWLPFSPYSHSSVLTVIHSPQHPKGQGDAWDDFAIWCKFGWRYKVPFLCGDIKCNFWPQPKKMWPSFLELSTLESIFEWSRSLLGKLYWKVVSLPCGTPVLLWYLLQQLQL